MPFQLLRVLRKLARAPSSVNHFDTAIDFKGKGDAFLKSGAFPEAEKEYREAVRLDPRFARAHFALGYTLHQLVKLPEATAQLKAALSLDATLADAHYILASIHQEAGQMQEAVGHLHAVVELDPANTFAYRELYLAYTRVGQPDLAASAIQKGLAHRSDSAELHLLAGNIEDQRGRFDEALRAYDRALALAPDSFFALNNRGLMLVDLARYDDALLSFEAALELSPDYDDAHYNEGLCRLVLGQFLLGWEKHERRWKSPTFRQSQGVYGQRHFERPQWSGLESIEGKTVLLHPEQGLGDTIQFCRYAPMLTKLGATVVLEVQSPLKNLLGDLQGVDTLIAVGEPHPEHHFHCSLMSLPYAFRTDPETVPSTGNYLGTSSAHRARAERWQVRWGPPVRPRIGVVWSGSQTHKNDVNRSISFTVFSQILSVNADFFCLQNELRRGDAELIAKQPNVQVVCDELQDFTDTAALIANLDLVICVDTSVAHLAGSLGRPVWVLLPANPDWRWMLHSEQTPWYRSMRLFRQPVLGDWRSVLERVRSELAVALPKTIIQPSEA